MPNSEAPSHRRGGALDASTVEPARRRRRWLVWATVIPFAVLFGVTSYYRHTPLPSSPPAEAFVGKCSAGVDRQKLCGNWKDAVSACDGPAAVHDAFPELSPAACYVPVRYLDGKPPTTELPPPGCGYPTDEANRTSTVAHLTAEAARYERVAEGDASDVPTVLTCALSDADRAVAATINGATLARMAERLRLGERFTYSAAATFGYGASAQDDSVLNEWRPGNECIELSPAQMDVLSINRERASRAAEAYHGGVAPIVIVSGGAVHSTLNESFMHFYLAHCVWDMPANAVLLDPCADHTHTNVRNTGALVRQLGSRTAYIVTVGLQAKYLQEYNVSNLIGGSIDQRALRDWGYLVGSWRQASVGFDGGFWYTPYRFWADEGLADATCIP